jgi:hypothetical protein
MSQITQIIDAIGNVSVNTLSKTPKVYSLDNASNSVKGTPARVVFPMQTGDNDGDMVAVTLGGGVVVRWELADLMLFAPIKNGSTLQASLPELVTYVGNYITQFKAQLKLGLKQVTIESIDYEWNQFVFPEGSKNEYYGVLMMLTVKEIVE